MLPKRKLLFHLGGVDDHIGTYITDYILAVVCLGNFLFLLRIALKYRKIDFEILKNSAKGRYGMCCLLPWNYYKHPLTNTTITTYAIMTLQMSLSIMALTAGFTHQFLQTVKFNKFVLNIFSMKKLVHIRVDELLYDKFILWCILYVVHQGQGHMVSLTRLGL